MIKPTKFNLILSNGTSIFTLEEMKQNLTPELFQYFHSGKLAKWLRVRKLDELADKMEVLRAAEKEHEMQLFKSLCEIFVSEVEEEEVRQAMQDYKKSNSQQVNSDDEVEQLKAEIEGLKKEIEETKQNSPQTKKYQVNQNVLNKIYQQADTYIKDKIPVFGLKTQQASFEQKLQWLSITKEDVLALYVTFRKNGSKYEINDFWCLTHDFFYTNFIRANSYYPNRCNIKISLKDIYYLNCKKGERSLIINHTECNVSNLGNELLVEFIADYLGLDTDSTDTLFKAHS